jgi:hypothetical protein
LLAPVETSALEPAMRGKALEIVLGSQLTWIHRSLESITDERVLQRVLLRLAQAQLPFYAQLRHGPLEFGKDVVALVDGSDGAILQMYQLKAGDITKQNWPKARDELEECFLVPLDQVQLPVLPQHLEAILFFNGHLNTYVEPVVGAWMAAQKRTFGRSMRLMHLDAIVRWIMDCGLINEYRGIAAELNLEG